MHADEIRQSLLFCVMKLCKRGQNLSYLNLADKTHKLMVFWVGRVGRNCAEVGRNYAEVGRNCAERVFLYSRTHPKLLPKQPTHAHANIIHSFQTNPYVSSRSIGPEVPQSRLPTPPTNFETS